MMRPRRYSTLNRSIARGITYSLRDYGKGKSKQTNTNTNSENGGCCTAFLVILFAIWIILEIGKM